MAVPTLGKQEIGENRLSLTRENKKSAKIDFPARGKTRNQQKLTFPHGGKQESNENWLSRTRENKKSMKIGFPARGKVKKY